ncbi:MAG: LysR family transcriptional regulator [Oscillospiraceae bacterium]|nr:LysR family transcriptional regulator [Oscillospiraceae bacterium]
MNIEALKTFIAVAELKNFTKAAQHLIVVQSTITNRIKELEREIGQQLLIRTNKSVILTHAGEHLLSYAYQFIDMESKMLDEINSIDTYTHRLNVGSVNCIYCCHLQPYFSNIIQNHKDVQVNLTLTHSRTLMQSLHNQSLDIAFSYLPLHDPNYHCTVFRDDEIILVTAPGNDVYPNGIHNDQLIKLPIIYSKFAPKVGFDWIHSIFPTNHVFQFTISVMEKIIPFLLEQPYYAFLPRKLVESYLANGSLCEIKLLDFQIPSMPCYRITHAKAREDFTSYFPLELHT